VRCPCTRKDTREELGGKEAKVSPMEKSEKRKSKAKKKEQGPAKEFLRRGQGVEFRQENIEAGAHSRGLRENLKEESNSVDYSRKKRSLWGPTYKRSNRRSLKKMRKDAGGGLLKGGKCSEGGERRNAACDFSELNCP